MRLSDHTHNSMILAPGTTFLMSLASTSEWCFTYSCWSWQQPGTFRWLLGCLGFVLTLPSPFNNIDNIFHQQQFISSTTTITHSITHQNHPTTLLYCANLHNRSRKYVDSVKKPKAISIYMFALYGMLSNFRSKYEVMSGNKLAVSMKQTPRGMNKNLKYLNWTRITLNFSIGSTCVAHLHDSR